MRYPIALTLALALGASLPAHGAQDSEPLSPDTPQERTLDSKIESVVLYQGRAAITRVAQSQLGPGIWKLRFDNLPATLQADTLEAKCSLGRILSVDFTMRQQPDSNGSPQALALDGAIRAKESEIAAINDTIASLSGELKFIESVSVRAASDASAQAGATKLDLAAVDQQLKWVVENRNRAQADSRKAGDQLAGLKRELSALVARRAAVGAPSGSAQSAEVLLAVTDGGPASVRLSYLVTNAQWEPVYSMRADPEAGTMAVEIDATVIQESGEEWKGVRLSLSTARPSRAARPGEVNPWFVDVLIPVPASTTAPIGEMIPAAEMERDQLGFPVVAGRELDGAGFREARRGRAEFFGKDATVAGSGPSVTYTIALPFDAPSDGQTRRRARIASFEAPTKFVHQAQPVVTDGAFLRGTLANTTPFQMLPGRASVFVSADYVGSMQFSGASPKQEFDVYFGADPALTVRRELVRRQDKASGLFGGGLDTVSDYRITVANGTGRTVKLELLDRKPVSRNNKIEVTMPANSAALSTDSTYLEEQAPLGILRWDLAVPATPTGADPMAIAWTIVVSRSKDIMITPLPAE